MFRVANYSSVIRKFSPPSLNFSELFASSPTFQQRRNFNKHFLISQYNQRKELLKSKKLPPNVDPLGVFANDEIDLGEIDVYGFDYDYTLATYRTSVEELIHHCAKQALVDKFKYPEALLKFEYDPTLAIRGLHYDILRGLLMKIDAFIQINMGSVYRGRQRLTDEEVLAIYKRRHLTNDMLDSTDTMPGLVQMVDTFAKPKMCLLVDVIQWFLDQKITYEPQSIYEDVQASIELAHPVFHKFASENPESLLAKDILLKPYLERLRQEGKQTFVITNSPFEIVDEGMKYLIGEDWQTLFDVVIVSARKPGFFRAKSKHFRIYSPKVKRLKWKPVLSLEQGLVYSGGTLAELQRLTGWGDDRVLYFGDHPYADLADLSMYSGWRTAAIIHELEDEIITGNENIMKWNNNWSNVLQSLLEEHQDLSDSPECKEVLVQWKDELSEIRENLKDHYNPRFGSVFRTNKNPTYFSRRLFRFADIYTSRVTNLSRYSLGHTFFPRRGVLPHEFRSLFN